MGFKYLKTIMKPTVVFDTELLNVGTKVHLKQRDHYENVEDWSCCYDEGDGVVEEISENSICILYDGYYRNSYRWLDVEDMESGFYTIELIK